MKLLFLLSVIITVFFSDTVLSCTYTESSEESAINSNLNVGNFFYMGKVVTKDKKSFFITKAVKNEIEVDLSECMGIHHVFDDGVYLLATLKKLNRGQKVLNRKSGVLVPFAGLNTLDSMLLFGFSDKTAFLAKSCMTDNDCSSYINSCGNQEVVNALFQKRYEKLVNLDKKYCNKKSTKTLFKCIENFCK